MPCTRLLVLTLTAVAVIVSGCGGSTKSGSSTAADVSPATSTTAAAAKSVTAAADALTRAQLIAAADRVCARANARIAKPGPAGNTGSNQEVAQNAQEIAGYDRAEVAGLRALVPPAELANDMRQIVAGFQGYANDVGTLGTDVQANDNASIQPLIASAKKLHEQVTAIAKRDGLTDCAKPTP